MMDIVLGILTMLTLAGMAVLMFVGGLKGATLDRLYDEEDD